MSRLWLNVEVTRYVAQIVLSGTRPDELDPEYLVWIVCPTCYWVALVYMPDDVTPMHFRCQRPAGDQHAEWLANLTSAHTLAPMAPKACAPNSVSLSALAPKVGRAMTAALQLGGTNAVLDILASLTPTEVGLQEQGVRAVVDFASLRPGSVRKK